MRRRQLQGMTIMGSANDMEAANKTYANFLALMKYSIPPIVLVVALVIWLIA